MQVLARLKRTQQPLLWTAALAGGASGLASAALAAVIHQALGNPEQSPAYAWPFVGLCALAAATRVGSEIALVRLTQGALRTLRLDLAQRLLATPLAALQSVGKPRLLAILTEDISTVAHAVEWVPALFVNTVLLLACVGYLLWLGGWLVLPVAAFIAVGALSFRALERRAVGHFARTREHADALHRHWRALVEGTKELQLNAQRRRAFVDSVLAPSTAQLRDSFTAGSSAYVWAANWGNLLFYAVIGFTLFGLAQRYPQPAQIWLGFALTLLFMIRPITDLMMALPILRRAAIALGKIEQLSGALESRDPQALAAPTAAAADLREIELAGVCYRYRAEHDDRPFELGPIDLVLRPGEIVFIAGGNGSGKSTLGLLIAGLYTPERGELRCGGSTLASEKDWESYRQSFAAVFSDCHVFEELLGSSGAQLDAAAGYLDRLGVAHRVRIERGRFSTLALSTGQRKRLALVAAYLEDRPVYVFDEWAADQDPEFKRVFYTQLLPELRAHRKLVVAITHDDAYFGCADRLVRLEGGRIVSDGPPPARAPGSFRGAALQTH